MVDQVLSSFELALNYGAVTCLWARDNWHTWHGYSTYGWMVDIVEI
jgi:hypothetical protein